MKQKLISLLIVVLCLGMLGGSGYLLYSILPQPSPKNVTALETESVFGADLEVVEPDREAAYEGDISAPVVEPETPEEPVQPPLLETDPEEEAAQARAQEYLATMTLEEKLWQMFFVTPEALTDVNTATRAGDATREALEGRPVGGVVYFAKNLENREQAVTMLANTQSYTKIPLFLAVDEEGGSVSRIGANEALGVAPVGSMGSYGEAGDPAKLYNDLSALASGMRELGFNMNFAPVADVRGGSGSVIGDRAFSEDFEVCAALVPIAVTAMEDNGVFSCLKHFPGYGSNLVDDHNASAMIGKPLEDLEAVDLLPFAAGLEKGASFVMVSHVSYPSVTGTTDPADLSADIVTELLREKMRFRGVIITDAQNMAAITEKYSSGEAALAAIQAGCDMVLMPANLMEAYEALLAAVEAGTLTEARVDESVLRILTAKARAEMLPEPVAEEPAEPEA